MARRVLLALLVVALGVLGAAWFSTATFTVTRTVAVELPTVLYDSTARLPEQAEMLIECSPTSSYYVTEGGDVMFFNEATGSPETPGPLCDEARAQRRLASVAFVLAGLLGGGVVIVLGRVRDRRADELVASRRSVSATPHAESPA
jgi:hypothetical protein